MAKSKLDPIKELTQQLKNVTLKHKFNRVRYNRQRVTCSYCGKSIRRGGFKAHMRTQRCTLIRKCKENVRKALAKAAAKDKCKLIDSSKEHVV